MVVSNFRKARLEQDRISITLVWEGGDARISGTFYKFIVQVILLFGLKTLVMTSFIRSTL